MPPILCCWTSFFESAYASFFADLGAWGIVALHFLYFLFIFYFIFLSLSLYLSLSVSLSAVFFFFLSLSLSSASSVSKSEKAPHAGQGTWNIVFGLFLLIHAHLHIQNSSA